MQLSALGVLCESHRSTEPPVPSSLPLLLTFLSLNGCTQSPNFRYPMITAVKKVVHIPFSQEVLIFSSAI